MSGKSASDTGPGTIGGSGEPKADPTPASLQEANDTALKIIAAMYWDLNAIWHLQRIVADQPYGDDLELYNEHCEAAQTLLDLAMSYRHRSVFQLPETCPNYRRCRSFLFEHGWRLFAMCAQAEAFREAYYLEETQVWDALRKLITANQRSIEVFVKSRNIDWRGPLLSYTQWYLPGLMQFLGPDIDIGKEHPHHLAQMGGELLKRPIHNGHAQTNINTQLYDPTKWVPAVRRDQSHPFSRPENDGPCIDCICRKKCPCHAMGGRADCPDCTCPKVCQCKYPHWLECFVCGSKEICQCRIKTMAGDLVELVEYPFKGTGVRALANFKKGANLGEYLGEVIPHGGDCTDSVYPLWQIGFHRRADEDHAATNVRKKGVARKVLDIGTITSACLGSWTRYINHHCESNCAFVPMVVGDKVTTAVVVLRDIAIFEEITVDYGEEYWCDRELCSRAINCKSILSSRIGNKDRASANYLVVQPPLLESTVGEHFAKVVAEHGDRTAVVSKHQGDRVSYASLDVRSNAFARGLQSIGVKKGDRVGVMLGNSMEYAVATYALFKVGAILVPLNPSFNAAQVIAALGHLESSHLIISTESNLPRKDPRSNVPLLEQLVGDLCSSRLESASVPSLKRIILVDNSAGRVDASTYKSLTPFSSILSQLSADGLPLPPQSLSPHDIVNIQFTSGTTAMPKAACLSHRSILNNGSQIGDRMLLTANDIVCCPPPLFHCFGSILGYMATATHGSTIVFPSESFNACAALKAVQEEKCTALYGVPTMFLEELELVESGEISSDGFQYLRTGIAAGSSIPAELMKKLHRVLNLTELTICYGMTETSPVSAMTTTDDPIDKRINTVGRLMPHVRAKVVDPGDRTRILPVNSRGELAVSGYLLMKEYWGDPQKTAEVIIEDDAGKAWMHTGDEAFISPDGYVTITGRIKDLIIRGGENIHPLEIENCLLAHSGVSDASVVGVPDGRYGEVVAAFVVAREQGSECITTDDIQKWYVFFLKATNAFPKTASGKIQKFKLKELAIKLLAEKKGVAADS
ncbi:uncharacterized protein N7482_002566 [Penicillium canariense]|uniref:SET domain-containing protein n=1 Tax=Penicillium canariense TaxID=189055 RepID=A0A9W9LUY5_9EURO|nr:uncharacterized protein N7482_002566 [Penicillium canariense]KAJ5176689.1 hypothetical protein N7482_002566 [Penicillium canariense]